MRSPWQMFPAAAGSGLRHSNDGTAIFSAAICAVVSACAAFSYEVGEL